MSLLFPLPPERAVEARSTQSGTNLSMLKTSNHTLTASKRPRTVAFDEDGPGHLSSLGPRHDNDHADYRKIQILPTIDEILAIHRLEYMPKKDTDQPHFLPLGPERLLDIHFRHLRYESVESIRDICYEAAQRSFLQPSGIGDGAGVGDTVEDPEMPFISTSHGNRYHLYAGVKFEECIPHDKKGMLVRLSFICPPSLRGHLIHKSDRLQRGMTCAVIALDHDTGCLSIVYCDVLLRESTYSMKSKEAGNSRAAVQLSFHSDATVDDVCFFTRLAYGLTPSVELLLVEFPHLLYVGFQSPLQRLQQMHAEDFAFSSHIAPQYDTLPTSQEQIILQPPAYALQAGFQYDLSPLTGDPNSKMPLSAFTGEQDEWRRWTLRHLLQQTTLDGGQAVALCDSLAREVAFTQGPPGTGKTFLGVALARVLLASRGSTNPKPIVIVCVTNHALDSFLEGLRNAGIENLLRIGNGSKQSWTSSININRKSRKQRLSVRNQRTRKALNKEKRHLFADMSSRCEQVSQQGQGGQASWYRIETVLKQQWPLIHAQFGSDACSPAIKAMTFEHWSSGGDLDNFRTVRDQPHNRSQPSSLQYSSRSPWSCEDGLFDDVCSRAGDLASVMTTENIWELPLPARKELLADWSAYALFGITARDFAHMHTQYQDLLVASMRNRDETDIKLLQDHNVIALTTTAMASRWEMLRSLEPEILIAEEAGEVLEAHALCSLLPTLKHSIFIGDPLQLRPEVREQLITLETALGSEYRLDESLFERLMLPRDPYGKIMPTAHLNIQRRMHPDIANISRLTYPFLKDHQSTVKHPSPRGLARRMFWMDHRVPESRTDDTTNSIFNQHEVDIVKVFVEYLLRGSEYALGDIAVLTPYAAQLQKLVENFHSTLPVWISEKDKAALVEKGFVAPEIDENVKDEKTNVELGSMLRVATVDNFQGEEANVIILSTVRSGGKPGFLKNANRINVACSRARNGFYVIGNSDTLSQVPMWDAVINQFDLKSARGTALELQCDRHNEICKAACTVQDFEDFPQCERVCGILLPCGHTCTEKCHAPELHSRFSCSQPCNTVLECGHKCLKNCSDVCGPCDLCQGMSLAACEHQNDTSIVSPLRNNDVPRTEPCNEHLPCGHLCPCLQGEACPPSSICPECLGQPFPEAAMVYHDSCNTIVEVRVCDELNLQDVYHLTDRGHRELNHDLDTNKFARPLCPNCRCQLYVNRYKNFTESSQMPLTMAQTLSEFYTREQAYVDAINSEMTSLDNTFDEFVKELNTSSTTAEADAKIIVQRGKKLDEIQACIISWRDHVSELLGDQLTKLHSLSPELIPGKTPSFHLHCEALRYRASALQLYDRARVVVQLKRDGDVTTRKMHLATQLLRSTYAEATTGVVCCKASIEDKNVDSNAVNGAEIRMQQARFYLWAHMAKEELQRTGFDTHREEYSVVVQSVVQGLEVAEATLQAHHSRHASLLLPIICQLRTHFDAQMNGLKPLHSQDMKTIQDTLGPAILNPDTCDDSTLNLVNIAAAAEPLRTGANHANANSANAKMATGLDIIHTQTPEEIFLSKMRLKKTLSVDHNAAGGNTEEFNKSSYGRKSVDVPQSCAETSDVPGDTQQMTTETAQEIGELEPVMSGGLMVADPMIEDLRYEEHSFLSTKDWTKINEKNDGFMDEALQESDQMEGSQPPGLSAEQKFLIAMRKKIAI